MSSGETKGNGQGDETGRLLAGRYRIMAQIGRGGMGVVWRAVDEVLDREVAVKELRTYTDADGPELADLRVRMQREARAAARIRHPGVIAVHDVAEVDGRPLIVMELIDGPSLDAVLRKGPLDPREAAAIGAKVVDALAAAHLVGVLHRDVKPGNILLDRSGRVVLTDFGIATMEDPGDGSNTHLTRTGHLVGSLDYMAPERAQGGDPGPASDVWALGATLYAAVEGASPFRRTSTFSTLTAIVGEPMPEPHRAGPLGPVLERLLDKRADERPGAEEARVLLQAVADGGGTDAATTTLRGAGASAAGAETAQGAAGASAAGQPESGRPGAEQAGEVEPSAGADGRGADTGAAPPGGPGPHPGSAQGVSGGPPGPYGATPVAPYSPGAFAQGPTAPVVGAQGPSVQGPFSQGGQGPFAQGPFAPGAGVPAGFPQGTGAPRDPALTGPMSATPTSARRRTRTLLAAAAVTVVLLAAGGAVALMNDTGQAETGAQVAPSGTPSTASSSASGRTDADVSDSATPSGKSDGKKSPSASQDPGGGAGSTPDDAGTTAAPTRTSGNGGTGTGSGDGSGSGDGGATAGTPTPAAACTSTGGGKYNCVVWKTAKSYTASGTEVGVLNAGTNYFYCQSNLGRRETSGEWTNVWWAKTDDDNGNTNVYVSDVYLKGGNNDEPVPGLPVC